MIKTLQSVILASFLLVTSSHTFDFSWFFKNLTSKPSLDQVQTLTFTPKESSKESSYKVMTSHEMAYELESKKFSNALLKITDTKNVEVTSGIPSDQKEVIIYVPGYHGFSNNGRHRYGGSVAHELYYYCKNNLIHVPAVTFYAPTSYRKTFNLGQENDQKFLDLVYQEVIRKNPKASIVFKGVCHGATTILNYITNPLYNKNMKQVKAVVMESPGISLEAVIERICQCQVPFGFRWTISLLFKFLLTGYKWGSETVLTKKNLSVPDHIAIFMGFLKHDDTVNSDHCNEVIKKLESISNHVYSYESNKTGIGHAKLGMDLLFQEKVHQFLGKYTLSNDDKNIESVV